MKILQIKDSKGYYALIKGEFIEIDKIDKDSIIKLLDIIIEFEVIMDDYNENQILQPAHSIIYKKLYDKFNELVSNKELFKNEANELYKDALEKYKIDDEETENSSE